MKRRITLIISDKSAHLNEKKMTFAGFPVESVEDLPEPIVQQILVTAIHRPGCSPFPMETFLTALERRWPDHEFLVEPS